MTNLSEAIVRLHDVARKIERELDSKKYSSEILEIADLITKVDYKLRIEEYDARD